MPTHSGQCVAASTACSHGPTVKLISPRSVSMANWHWHVQHVRAHPAARPFQEQGGAPNQTLSSQHHDNTNQTTRITTESHATRNTMTLLEHRTRAARQDTEQEGEQFAQIYRSPQKGLEQPSLFFSWRPRLKVPSKPSHQVHPQTTIKTSPW